MERLTEIVMKVFSFLPAFLFLILCAGAARATTVTLAVAPNPATYGSAITLTATVSPSGPGTVTFYDGVAVVGLAPVIANVATLITHQLSSGTRNLSARYLAAKSATVVETVTALAGAGFDYQTSYNVGFEPYALAVGDLNGDGKLDVVLPVQSTGSGTWNQVSVVLGNGDGTFQPPISISVGLNIVAVAIGDFNGDGIPDLALADAGDYGDTGASIDILLGNGNGTFHYGESPFTNTGLPASVVVGDFNGDGQEDLAIATQCFGNSNDDVAVFFGNGDGSFQDPYYYATGTTIGAAALAVGDYNGDGYADLAVAEDNIVILAGSSGGIFSVGSVNTAGDAPSDVETADFNNDGKADLAVANFYDGSVSVLLGNGNGTFQPQVTYVTGAGASLQNGTAWLALADFNGDGFPDIAASNSFSDNESQYATGGSISIFLNQGNGTFQQPATYQTSAGPFMIAAADLTGQGTPDILTEDYGDGVSSGDLGVFFAAPCVSVTTSGLLNYASPGGTPIFNVNTLNSSCAWTATANVPWIQLTAASGTGTSAIGAIVSLNSSGADRTGTVTIAGQTFTVFQDFTPQTFTDVTPSEYYFDAVNELAAHEITAGCGGTDYCPATVVTRDEMAIFIVRSVYGGDDFTYSSTPYFNDVTSATFGFAWIQKLFELGISAGCGGGDYCPTAQVTRDQMAIFIIRARYGATTAFTVPPGAFFTDVPSTYFAFPWIQRMKEDFITGGCGAATYCPATPVTRGDMAIFIMRAGFNQLLPVGTPFISAIAPNSLTHGTSATFNVTGVNTHFGPSTVIVPAAGVTATNIHVTSLTQLSVTLTAASSALLQPDAIYIQTEPEEAVLPNGLVVQ